jgi:hypothetical protein
MILGQTITVALLVPGGIALALLAVFQVLVGKRVIKFKGKTHMRVHRWGAYLMLFLAFGHGLMGMVLAGSWELL